MNNLFLYQLRHLDTWKCFIIFIASEFFNVLKCNVFAFRFSLPVTATAENCILTIYPYLATYFDKQNIILKDGKLHVIAF